MNTAPDMGSFIAAVTGETIQFVAFAA
jgi:hypothetical protein